MKQHTKLKTPRMRGTRAFLKKGTCSRTFFYLLNREYGHPREEEEQAIDPLAGGILQQGYQCGMLWGASMAAGAEAHRRSKNMSETISMSIEATKHVMNSFTSRTKSIECEEITNTNFNSKWSFAKYMMTGRFVSCFKLAGKWAPEALMAANEGLSVKPGAHEEPNISCASEVVKRMGGTEQEQAMVSGLAGGLGLSGSACGALAATIWKKALQKNKEEQAKPSFDDPELSEIVQKFYEVTDYKMECHEICEKQFKTIDEHSAFIRNGGCKKLINTLSES